MIVTLIGCLGSLSTHAVTIFVNNSADTIGPQQTLFQRCVNQLPAGQCTLRAANMLSNQLVGADTIVLPATTYTLWLGELKFVGDVTLQGAGPLITVINNAANKKNRILNFTQANKVALLNLTVRGGVLEAYEGQPYKYESGAGVRAVGVSDFIVDNSRIVNNTISMKAGPWPEGFQETDKSAASGLYVEGGLSLINGSWVSQNKIVFANINKPAAVYDTSSIYAISKAQQKITIQNSFIENNSGAEYVQGYDFFSIIRLHGEAINIGRSFFRKNDMQIEIGTHAGTVTISESHFQDVRSNQNIVISVGTGLLSMSGSAFEEAPVMVTNNAVEGSNTDSLRPNIIVNNTFRLSNRPSQIPSPFDKTLAIAHYGSVESVRSTVVNHNTFDFEASALDHHLYTDMAAVYIESPTVIQSNIINAHAEPGYMHEVFPCYINTGYQEAFPLNNLGGNLIFSPDLTQNTENEFNCALSGSDMDPAEPQLDELKWNGGWTPTMALLPGSPALSTAPEPIGISVPFDQRGKKRPQGTGRDIGAFEAAGGPVPNFD